MRTFRILALCLLLAVISRSQEVEPQAPSWNDGKIDREPPTMRIRCGGDCAQSVSTPSPAYRAETRARKLQGTVRLQAVIGKEGGIRKLETLSGNPILAKAAIAAAQHWKYRPTLLNGSPVEVVTIITVVFQLDGHKTTTTYSAPK